MVGTPSRLCCVAMAGMALLLLGTGCSTQQEASPSALHYFKRANEAFLNEDFRGAVVNYHRAADFDPQAADIHYNLGLAYYQVGDYHRAVQAYTTAIRIDPDFADAYFNLALAYDRLYDAPAADANYNRYREIMARGAPPPSQGTQHAGAPKRKAPPPMGGTPLSSLIRPTTQARPGAAAAHPAPGMSHPTGSGSQTSQGKDKWWTQERFIPKQ